MFALAILALVLWGCGDREVSPTAPFGGSLCDPAGKISDNDNGGEGSGEHGRGGEHGNEGGEGSEGSEGNEGGGEESATQYARTDTFDEVRAGARLIISYFEDAGEFRGTVENTTDRTLQQVRVEVHLSNGVELGPTTPTDMAPGETIEVVLSVSQKDRNFSTYGAHPEVGSSGQEDSATVVLGGGDC